MFEAMKKKLQLLAIITVAMTMVYHLFRSFTPPFESRDGKILEGSVSFMEKIQLGGDDQWIFIRGKDFSKPLLLFLHGGPGSTTTAHIRRFLPELEEKFVVIHWDQRGAGKSFSAGRPAGRFSLDQLINDTGELTQKMLSRFQRDKMYLMAASWGTYLGIEAVKRWPQYYQAYIGSGQIVYQMAGEQLSYDYALSQAKAHADREAVVTLESIGRPPYPEDQHVQYLMKQRSILLRYDGSFKNKTIQKQFSDAGIIWRQEEYNILDKINWVRGQYKSERVLGPEFRAVNFIDTAIILRAPIYLIQGLHDWQTPTKLVEEYFKTLQAPQKRMYVFEESAHIPMVEEKEKFLALLDKIVAENNHR